MSTTVLEYKRRYYLLLLVEWLITVYVRPKLYICYLLGIKPAYNSFWYDRRGVCKNIRRYAKSNQTALSLKEVNRYSLQKPVRNFDEWSERLWMNMPAAQAVRNRKVIVTEVLEAEVRRRWQVNGQPVRGSFLAGGLVETGIEVAVSVKRDGILMDCLVLDISRRALRDAEADAVKAGVGHMFTFKQVNLLDVEVLRAQLAPRCDQFIELMGVMDYFNDEEAIEVLKVVKSCMAPDGMLLTGNILPNFLEVPFLSTVVSWPAMYHRNFKQVDYLLDEAGYITDTGGIDLLVEPHRLFMVLVVRLLVGEALPTAELAESFDDEEEEEAYFRLRTCAAG